MTEVEDQYQGPAPDQEQTSAQPPRPQFARAKTISLPAERQMDKVASETQDQRKYSSLKRNGPSKPWAELLQPSNELDQFPDGEVSKPIVDTPDSHVLTHSPSPTNTDTTESESCSEDSLSPTLSTSPGPSPTDIKTNSPPEEKTPSSPLPPSAVGNNETKSSEPPISPTQPPTSPTQPPTSPTKSPTSPTRPPAMKLPPRPYPPSQARYLEARLKKKRPPPPGPRIIDTRSTPTAKPTSTTDSSPSPTGNETRNLKIMQAEVSSFSSIPKRPPPPSNTPSTTPTPAQPKDEPIAILQATPKPLPSSDDPVKPRGILKKNNTTPLLNTTTKVDFAEETESIDELQPLPNLDSPRDDKKFVSKMKSSFRNFTHRKKHGKDDVHSSPSSRRTISGSRPASKHSPAYDQKRYPAKLPVGIVSPLVVQCVAYLNRPESLNEPGLFRIPGDMCVMKKYRASFAMGEEVDLCSDCHDPHTVAGLLKLHFREQRQCLIPGDALMEKIVVAVREKDVDEFRALVESVDTKAQAGIRMVAELLKKIAENSEVNHMTSGTLATSCGPSFFPRLGPSSANAVLKFLADNCDAIFST